MTGGASGHVGRFASESVPTPPGPGYNNAGQPDSCQAYPALFVPQRDQTLRAGALRALILVISGSLPTYSYRP